VIDPVPGLTEAWTQASAALPLGWWLEGLRCASTGLAPHLRDDRWRAIACGPNDECLEAEGVGPIEALNNVAVKLRERRGSLSG
jgi:hypothetical protein